MHLEKSEIKKRRRHLNRIVLDEQNFMKLDGWVQDLQDSIKGISVSHNDLANWSFARAPLTLTDQDQSELKTAFFDDVRFLKQLLSQARKAKATGEKLDLSGLMPEPKTRLKRKLKKGGDIVRERILEGEEESK